MLVGLSRILDLIRVNPQDTLLVDRFLILASDLKEDERVEVTLGLSEALVRKNPRRAIELAHMVYKARPGDHQPLELMVEGFENLGRYGKATVLRQQLEKVKKAQLTSPGLVKKVVDDSIATIDRELLQLVKPDIPVPPKTPIEKKPLKPAIEAHNPWSGIDQAIAGAELKRVVSPTVLEDDSNSTPSFHDLAEGPKMEDVSEKKTPEGLSVPDEVIQESEESSANYHSIREEVAGIPWFRPPVRPQDEDLGEAGQEVDKNPESSPKALKLFSCHVQNKDWDALWDLIQGEWSHGGTLEVMLLAKSLGIERIDVRFMGWWLDTLLNVQRPLQALCEARLWLNDQPLMSFARVLYPRIKKSIFVLGLKPFDWTENSGVMSLIMALSSENLESLASIGIINIQQKRVNFDE